MSSNKFSYPHPILGNYDDILPTLADNCVTAKTASDDSFHYYEFTMVIEDETILRLISQNKAKYAIHYKCRSTLFEGKEVNSNNTIVVKIPRKEVIEKIEFYLFIIATESFTYNNPSANPIFMGCSFDVNPNDPLVFFPKQWDNLDISYQTLKHYSSILVPVPDDNLHGNDISIKTDERIEVHLSQEAYSKLKLANKSENAEEIIGVFVQNALLSALFQLFLNSEDEDEIRNNNKPWVEAIFKRMREEAGMPTLEDVIADPCGEIPSLVQRLLNFPIGALLDKLNKDADTESESEDSE